MVAEARPVLELGSLGAQKPTGMSSIGCRRASTAELLCRPAEELRRVRTALPRIEHEEHRPVLLRRVPHRQVVRVRDLRMFRTSDSIDGLASLEFLGGRACRDEKEQRCDQ